LLAVAAIVLSRAKFVNSPGAGWQNLFRLTLTSPLSNTGLKRRSALSFWFELSTTKHKYLRCDAPLWFIDLARLYTTRLEDCMPKFVIEREIPGAGDLSPEELRGISQTSCGVLQQMGPRIQWLHSYVTGDKIYCVYIAPNEETIREHAQAGGFPANRVSQIKSVIDPTTAEG
jgi:hypothetical protein